MTFNDNSTAASGTTGNCSEVDGVVLAAAAILNTVVAVFSLLCSCVILSVILIYKKYIFFTQELVLYLVFGAVLVSLSRIAAGISHWAYTTKAFCAFCGFFITYSTWTELLAIFCVTLNLFLSVLCDMRMVRLRWAYLAVTFVVPLLWCWVPFLYDAYGLSGAWCWIRSYDVENSHHQQQQAGNSCSLFVYGQNLRLSLWVVPLPAMLVVICVMCAATVCKVRKDRRRWEGMMDHETRNSREQLEKVVRPLLWYPLAYIIPALPPLVSNALETFGIQYDVLWLAHAFTIPLPGVLIALVYTVDSQTFKQLKFGRLRAACQSRLFSFSSARSRVRDYPFEDTMEDSFNAVYHKLPQKVKEKQAAHVP